MLKNTKHNNPPHNHFKFIKLQQTWLNPTTLEERTENIQDQQTATTTTNEFRITTLGEEIEKEKKYRKCASCVKID